LAEIESLISKVTEQRFRVVAEVMTLENEQQPMLIACIADAETSNDTCSLEEKLISQPTTSFVHLSQSLPREPAVWLPRYMIPSIYVPVQSSPLTIHEETDRKRLRDELSELARSSIVGLVEDADTAVNIPLDSQEEALLGLWSQVLKAPIPYRRKNLSFFQLGRDSFAAIGNYHKLQSYNTSITAVTTLVAHPTILALISAPALFHGVSCSGTRLPSTVLFAVIHTNSTLLCTKFDSGLTNRPRRTSGIAWRVKRSYVLFAPALALVSDTSRPTTVPNVLYLSGICTSGISV
jgi:hypothetical protein